MFVFDWILFSFTGTSSLHIVFDSPVKTPCSTLNVVDSNLIIRASAGTLSPTLIFKISPQTKSSVLTVCNSPFLITIADGASYCFNDF
jgi:hypothetical protein